MNRRHFFRCFAGVPFLGWLFPASAPSNLVHIHAEHGTDGLRIFVNGGLAGSIPPQDAERVSVISAWVDHNGVDTLRIVRNTRKAP